MDDRNTIKIAKATTTDIPNLVGLLLELFTQEEEFTPNPDAHIKGLAKVVDSPETGVIFLARIDNKVVGMVSLLFTISTALGKQVSLLEDMIVCPSERNIGIGTQLLSEAILYAKSKNCGRITLLTDITNKTAQNFYRKHDFFLSNMIPMRMLIE